MNRRSFLGMTLGVSAVAALPPLVVTATAGEVDPRRAFVGFMHLDTGEMLPFGPIEYGEKRGWVSEPYLATETFTVVAWTLYRNGILVVDCQPYVCTLRPNDTVTLDLSETVMRLPEDVRENV